MRKAKVFAAVMVMLLLAQQTQAGVSLIMNGSFEDNHQYTLLEEVNQRLEAIAANDAAILATSSIGHWKMNDNEPNTTVIDSSGNGNHGTAQQNTKDLHVDSGNPPYLNGALTFNGTSDYIDVGDAIGTGVYTKVAWIKRADAASYNNIVSGTSGHAFWAPSSQSFKLSSGHNGSWYVVQDSEDLAVDTWYHVAVTFDPAVDSGTMVLYKDGALVSGPKAVATGVAPPSPSATTYIGRYASGYYFEGAIDNVMVFDKVLTGAEIETLYTGTQQTQAGVSLIMNGSFEDDGIINDIAVKAPRRWCDVNLPVGQFGGWVDSYWSTHGDYSLILFSKSGLSFAVGDMATVSQDVYLMDVNQIIFDIELSGTHSAYPWQSEKFSAIVFIDGNVVWDSRDWVPDGDGVYSFEVDGIDVNDANLHTLSLAMRANKDEHQFTQYTIRWDFVKFDAYCGGFGYLPQDLNHDCYVDTLDLKVLTEQWLAEELNQEYDLFRDQELIINFPDFATFASYWQDTNCPQTVWCGGSDFDRSGTVDFTDLKIFAEHWLGQVVFLLSDLAEDDVVNFKDFAGLANRWRDNTDWRNWQDDNCFELELPASDLDYDGIVNFRDFAILAGDWRSEGACIRGDIERDKVVDYKDIARLADEWLLKSWLYGLE